MFSWDLWEINPFKEQKKPTQLLNNEKLSAFWTPIREHITWISEISIVSDYQLYLLYYIYIFLFIYSFRLYHFQPYVNDSGICSTGVNYPVVYSYIYLRTRDGRGIRFLHGYFFSQSFIFHGLEIIERHAISVLNDKPCENP